MGTVESELESEQAHLRLARAELRRMRERAESLDAAQASDAVSAEALSYVLARRIASLQDDPGTTLFFGRIDRLPPAAAPEVSHDSETPEATETPEAKASVDSGVGVEALHIGRRHVGDEAGDPVVIDWRAPVSTAFYRATRADPLGVLRRRRFGVARGSITGFEDELLSPRADAAGPGRREDRPVHSRLLADEIERPRTGPMRDIVATIQPEQDEIVRSDLRVTVCVQGAPGTGKTAVGLHRAAWLLYSHRSRLERTGVLVIGPNRAFIDHIGAVLPSLGEVRVAHATVESLLAHGRVRATDPTDVAVLKGDARLAVVLERAVWGRVERPSEALVVPRGVHRWRLPASEVTGILDMLRERDITYGGARELLPLSLAHHLLLVMERAGEIPDDRVVDTLARSAPVRAYVKTVWPVLDAAAVLHHLFSDPAALSVAAAGVLDEREQRMLLWAVPARSKGAARWSVADLALLDEAGSLLARQPTRGHVVIDEAQDLSPMQLRAVGRRAGSGSLTVLGDIAQGTTPWSSTSWAAAMAHLGKREHELVVLDRGFRVPAAVIDYAARLLPAMAPGLGAPRSVRENPGRLEIRPVSAPVLYETVAHVTATAASTPGSVGVIAPDAMVAALSAALTAAAIEHGRLDSDHGDDDDHQALLVPATVAKGLEFDRTVVVEPAAIAAAEPDERTGLRRLYVVLTRAVSETTIVHSRPLPSALGPTPNAD